MIRAAGISWLIGTTGMLVLLGPVFGYVLFGWKIPFPDSGLGMLVVVYLVVPLISFSSLVALRAILFQSISLHDGKIRIIPSFGRRILVSADQIVSARSKEFIVRGYSFSSLRVVYSTYNGKSRTTHLLYCNSLDSSNFADTLSRFPYEAQKRSWYDFHIFTLVWIAISVFSIAVLQ